MKLVQSAGNPLEKVVFVAEDMEDMKVLNFLYDEGIVFGMWKLFEKTEDKKETDEYIFLDKHYPTAVGLAWVNMTGQKVRKPWDDN